MSPETPVLRSLRHLLPGFILVAAVVTAAFVAASRWWDPGPLSPERQVYNLLKSDAMAFLVTQRLTSQITVEVDESSLWLGSSRGTLTGIVRMYYGVDLEQLTPGSVHREGDVCVVDLPEPAVLDFAVDVGTLSFRTERSILQIVGDRLRGHDLRGDLQNRFRSAAEAYFREQELMPDRATLCARLTEHSESWSGRVGAEVRFR